MKKTLILSLALVAMMVMACGQSQEEIAAEAAAQEQLISDSIANYEATLPVETPVVEVEDSVVEATIETPAE